ncbi:MAG: alpha/beta fold hydrolase [Proteobacteria bacterium]|nr:alpha/beta fold hydrolase [Pseudomonadota bacterium]
MVLFLFCLLNVLFAAPEPELNWVEAKDGGWLALTRYKNEGGPPVVLCHGISSNHYFWDLEPGRSLALNLHEAGFDVWNMDLRGHGTAEKNPKGKRQRPGWTIDTYGQQDLPAAFAHVQQATGKERMHYVGHSLGGMVLAVYMAHSGRDVLASAVAVGTPLDFRDPDLVTKVMFKGAPLAKNIPFLPTPLGARYLGLAKRTAPGHFDEMVMNPANMTPASETLTLRTVVSPLSKGEIRQFSALPDGEFRSTDGQILYREALEEIDLPMLFIAGRADRIVAADMVRTYHDSLGTMNKKFVVASVTNGFHGDYGHLDLGIGNHAEEDVFPLIRTWLEIWP